MFSDAFNDEEMGRIAGIEVKSKQIAVTEKGLDDCIKILLDYKNNPLNKNNNQLSDDDLLNIIKSKR